MAFKNSLKILIGKGFFLLRGLPPRFWPACRSRPSEPSTAPRASPWPGPAPCRASPACLRALAPSPARRAVRRATLPTASGDARRVAALCWRRTPRGSHGLRPLPRARLHLLPSLRTSFRTPALSGVATAAAHARAAELADALRRRRAPAPPRHSPIPRARNSASPSFKSCSSLRRLPSTG